MMSELGGATVAFSVHEAGFREAERYKWIESEKQGRDLGEMALRDWFRKHWFEFCRHRHLEHVQGDCCWSEFGEENFGRLYRLIVSNDPLTLRILDRIAGGMENLDVIWWALDSGIPCRQVREVLKLLDINEARLDPRIN